MESSLPPDTTTFPISEQWFSIDGVSHQWPVVRPQTIRTAIARGELRAARLGVGRRRIVIKGAWILEWLERCAEPQEIRR